MTMATKKDEKKEKNGMHGLGFLLIVLIITTFLSTMGLLIKLDVGGFGSGVLRPVFKDIPVIKEILPPPSDEEVARESDYPFDTLEKAVAEIDVLNAAVKSKDAEIVALNDRVTELENEVTRLKTFEDEQVRFEAKKNQFYNEIVYGDSAPDADTYKEWYNELDAEYAEKIYREMLERDAVDKEILELARSYESMDASKAAKILEQMKTDMDTVALILNSMSSEAQGKILAAMDAAFAAKVTKKLLP